MAKHSHLSLDGRITIAQLLKEQSSFKAIARELGRDLSTISKEVRRHRIPKKPVPWGNLSTTVSIGSAATVGVFVPAAKATVTIGPVANVFQPAAITNSKYVPASPLHPMSAMDAKPEFLHS